MVRIPCAERVDVSLWRWTLWASRQGLDIDATDPQSFGAAEARNNIVREFMASGAERLWMLDADTVPPQNLSILEYDEPIVCGVYAGYSTQGVVWHVYKHLGLDKFGHHRYGSMPKKSWPRERLFGADAAGTGCMVIHRSVFEGMRVDPFHQTRRKDGRLGTEDFNFCREAGGVHILQTYVCRHFRTCNVTPV